MSSEPRLLMHARSLQGLNTKNEGASVEDLPSVEIAPADFAAYAACLERREAADGDLPVGTIAAAVIYDLNRLSESLFEVLGHDTLAQALRRSPNRAPAQVQDRLAALTVHDAIGWLCAAMANQTPLSLRDLITEFGARPEAWGYWAAGFTPDEAEQVPVYDAVALAALQGWTLPPVRSLADLG